MGNQEFSISNKFSSNQEQPDNEYHKEYTSSVLFDELANSSKKEFDQKTAQKQKAHSDTTSNSEGSPRYLKTRKNPKQKHVLPRIYAYSCNAIPEISSKSDHSVEDTSTSTPVQDGNEVLDGIFNDFLVSKNKIKSKVSDAKKHRKASHQINSGDIDVQLSPTRIHSDKNVIGHNLYIQPASFKL